MASQTGTVLITGSNRGIGLEFVKQYLLLNWEVMATCRNPEDAAALKKLSEAFKIDKQLTILRVSKRN